MTSVVQNVGYTAFAGASSKVITLSATVPGNSIILLVPIEGGGSTYTGCGVTDNAAGGSNVYTVRKSLVASGGLFSMAFILDCLNAPKSCTQITITPTGGTLGAYGCGGALEVSGGTLSADQSGSNTGSGTSPLTVTNSTVDVGTTDIVIAVALIGGGNTNAGITDPPSGYTAVAVQQDDSADAASQCAYRINSSALTDSVSFLSVFQGVGVPGILQSYKVSASVGATIAWTT